MVSAFTINGEDLSVYSWSGFDLPDDLQPVRILSTGSSDHDEVLQQGSTPMPRATLQGRTTDIEVIRLLRALRQSHVEVTFTEPDEGSHQVVVDTLSVSAATPATFIREWQMTLIEVSAGAGSGS
jgi:hypothetical protein